MEEDEFHGYGQFRADHIEEERFPSKSARPKGVQRDEIPTCAMCMEVLGTYGGPASLACGHNGCLECLQQVRLRSRSLSLIFFVTLMRLSIDVNSRLHQWAFVVSLWVQG